MFYEFVRYLSQVAGGTVTFRVAVTDIVTVDACGVSGHLFSMDLLVLIKRENLGKLQEEKRTSWWIFQKKNHSQNMVQTCADARCVG